jgi:hypothetical protein
MSKEKSTYIPKDIAKQTDPKNHKKLEPFYKLVDCLNSLSNVHTTGMEQETAELLIKAQGVMRELHTEMIPFLSRYIKEVEEGNHQLKRFSTASVVNRYLISSGV